MNKIIVNISEAKVNLSKYTNLVKKGQTITISERNVPFAQIIPLPTTPDELLAKRKKIIGSLKGKVKIKGSILKPLSEKELADWGL